MKHFRKKILKSGLAIILALTMLLSNIPLGVFDKVFESWKDDNVVDVMWQATQSGSVIDSFGPLKASAATSISFVGAGAKGNGTSNVTPGLPSGWAENDIFLLHIEGEGEDANADPQPSGWGTLVDTVASATNGTTDRTRQTIYWRRATASESAPTVPDAGNHTLAVITAWRGVTTSGSPIHNYQTSSSSTNNTSVSITGFNTTIDDAMIVASTSAGDDNGSGNSVISTNWANANLSNPSIAQAASVGTTSGSDGSISVAYGGLTNQGATGTTTVSAGASEEEANFTIALIPAVATDATASAGGTQTSGMVIPSTNNYVGGKFAIAETGGGSRNVTGVTISEQGTVDAQADLDNIKLYYESDTSDPYDCDSEAYGSGGSETQFGSTDTDGFSAANGTSAFSGTSVGISATSTLCVYVVLDIGSGASNGETLEIQITDPSSDVTVSSGTTGPGSAVAISGTTTLQPPGVVGTLGKTTDSWSGAVPVYMELVGLSQGSYPYARAQVTTIASQTFYTDMTWDSGDSRYEGTIYIGSNICMGCDDPKTYNGSFSVTVQLDNNAGFPSVDYSDSAGTFTTFITLKRSSMDAATDTNYTDFNAVWDTDHWNISIDDFAFSRLSGTGSNTAVAVPIHPVTSTPSNFAVSFNGSGVSEGSAESTSNAWWYDSASHTLYLQFASLTTTLVDVDIDFDSDTDLFATRYNHTQTADMGSRRFSNGLYVANHYLTTFYYGKPFSTADNNVACSGNECEGTGMQAESRAHEDGGPDESTDCMERVAVHVDDTPRSDGTGLYQYDAKWKQSETATWITSESDTQIVIETNSDDTASTGWAQQLNNGIAIERIQTYYSGERYIKNVYNFTNNDSSSHKYPMVWEREQWHGTDRATNDSGRFQGDSSDRVVEERIALSSFSCPWQTAYDTGTFINMGVVYDKNDLPDYGIFAVEPFLAPTTAEWPITITEDHATNTADQTGFEKTWATVAASETVSFTFWHVHNAESSWANIASAMDADCAELNPALISILIGDGDISYGLVQTSQDTTSSGVDDTQTVTNNGDVAEDFEIIGQDSADWTLGGSAGDAIYKHAWCITNCDSSPTWTAITTAYTTLVTNIAATSYQDVDFQVTVPTSNAGSNEQDVDITIRAVEH